MTPFDSRRHAASFKGRWGFYWGTCRCGWRGAFRLHIIKAIGDAGFHVTQEARHDEP